MKRIDFKIKNIEILNDVKTPIKFNDKFNKKISSFKNLNFVKNASKKYDDISEEEKEELKFPLKFDLKKEMEDSDNYLFVRALAIIADEPNDNGDYFTEDELKKAFHTFVGCPFFVNHQNEDVEQARGEILYSEWDEDLKGIVVIGKVDSKAYPKLARGISEGYISGVSMGTVVEYSECSICQNKAKTEEDFCTHVREYKTRKYNGKQVYEINYGLRFIELSFVVDPACRECHVQDIYDIDDLEDKINKAACNIQGFKKNAGKQELDKLNQAEQLLQEVSESMLGQRQYIDLEYLSDLVDVLASLQNTKDELVDMGYTQVPSSNNIDEYNTDEQNFQENINENEGQNNEENNLNEENGPVDVPDVGTITGPNISAKVNKRLKYSKNFNDLIKYKLKEFWKGKQYGE